MSVHAARQDRLVSLGYIAGVHGIRGWVKVHSFTEPREAILEYQPWLIGERRQAVHVREGHRHGKSVIAALPGVDDRERARRWLRQEIAVYRHQLPEPRGDAYYWADLEGLEVVTEQGERLGRVSRLLETGANDVMVVDGDEQRLIPFVRGQYVKEVDFEQGRIEVDWDPEF